ncbi:excisionase [Erwinia amylovora]
MKLVTLKQWAELNLEPPLPGNGSLYCAAQNKLFHPPAKKQFGRWRVASDAVLVDRELVTRKDDPPDLLRILNDGKTT